jgi:hypothetical protein
VLLCRASARVIPGDILATNVAHFSWALALIRDRLLLLSKLRAVRPIPLIAGGFLRLVGVIVPSMTAIVSESRGRIPTTGRSGLRAKASWRSFASCPGIWAWHSPAWSSSPTPGGCRRLPRGPRTTLSPSYDGVELSQGQWQRIASARASMRSDPLLFVLDEPTASLDAPSEHETVRRYISRAKCHGRRGGTIAVIVSHRFSRGRRGPDSGAGQRAAGRARHTRRIDGDGRSVQPYVRVAGGRLPARTTRLTGEGN